MCFECGDVITDDEDEDRSNSDSASTTSDSKRYHRCKTCRQETLSFTNDEASPLATTEDPALSSHPGRPHACPYCSKAFADSSKLKRHVKIHLGVRDFKCETCGKGFIEACSLRRHESVHSDVKPHNCSLCGKGFTDSSGLKKHLVKCNGQVKDSADGVTSISVKDCQVSSNAKVTHSSIVKEDPEENENFEDVSKVKAISKVTKEMVTPSHTIPKFNRDSECKEMLENERNSNAGISSKQNLPAVPNAHKSLQSKSRSSPHSANFMKTEIQTTSPVYFDQGVDSQLYVCRECGKSYEDEMELRRHFLIHVGNSMAGGHLENAVVCQVCGKMFVSLQYLQKHILKNHIALLGSAGDAKSMAGHFPPFFLPGSSQSFSTAKEWAENNLPVEHSAATSLLSLRNSMGESSFDHSFRSVLMSPKERSSPDDRPSPSVSPYPSVKTDTTNCEVCGKVFADSSSLKRHARLHTEQPQQFSCETCDKVFTDQGSLKRHWLRGCKKVAVATKPCSSSSRPRVSMETGAEDQFACTQCQMVS